MERIQKILAHGGIASRRAAEQLIKDGRVRVNGRIVTELGAKADPRRDRVEVDGKRVVAEAPVYVVLHKPRGVVSTMSDPEGRPTVSDLLAGLGARVYPVGRLDFATSGVLIATNDGELADGLLHPKKTVPKTYVLKVKGVMSPDDLDVWRKGVRLEDGMTLPADAKLLRHEGDKTWFELTIREGRNQQIRRMGDATGFPVMRLARVAFAGISAEGLAPGRYRHLTRDELVDLKKEYGVPRSIPSAASIPQTPEKIARRAVPVARRGSVGRAQRAFGAEERSEGAENWGEARPRSHAPAERGEQRAERPRRGYAAPEARDASRPHRGGGPEARGPSAGRTRSSTGASGTRSSTSGGEDWGTRPARPSTRGQDRNGSRRDAGGGAPAPGGARRPPARKDNRRGR